MDVCSDIDLPVTDDVNDFHRLCMSTLEHTHGVLKVVSVGELSNDVTEFLNIEDNREEDSRSSLPCKNCEFQMKDACGKSNQNKIMTRSPQKCLSKCATFPCSGKTSSSPPDAITSEKLTHDGNIKSPDPSGFRCTSLPTNLKPVSALKGSREKRGAAPPEKLTVKWAPDVYDPIPTSVSHVVTNNRSSRHGKKNSRNKQKNGGGKSSRGSKGKEKKQVRKRGGNSCSMGYKVGEQEEEVVDFHEQEAQPVAMDFHVGNPDRFCGSSFLKRYGTSMHLSSVGEAT